jgi:hypothetical protein
MKKASSFLYFLLVTGFAMAQLPDTDIFVAEMKWTKDSTYFKNPVNITHREGYDNHPYFSANGSALYYSATDYKQCDIKRYFFATRVSANVNHSKESDFSPGLTPDGKSMSVVRIDLDSAQRAYTFPLNDAAHPVVIAGTDSIGYYCWLKDTLLAMFIIGEPSTLQILNRNMLTRTTVSSNIGRCLKLSADSSLLYFLVKHSETDWRIHTYNVKTAAVEEVAETMPGDEDFAVLHDGTLLMGDHGKLFALKKGKKKWKEVADFTASVGNFNRISISPKEDKIALVGILEKKP